MTNVATLDPFARTKGVFQGRISIASRCMRQRKLAEPCGFCKRGECRFGAGCGRTKRALEVSEVGSESVAPTDLGRATRKSEGDEERDVATVSGGSGSDEAADSDGDFGFRLVGAAAEGIFSFRTSIGADLLTH